MVRQTHSDWGKGMIRVDCVVTSCSKPMIEDEELNANVLTFKMFYLTTDQLESLTNLLCPQQKPARKTVMLRNSRARSYQSVSIDEFNSEHLDDGIPNSDNGHISNMDDFDFYAHSMKDNILSYFNLKAYGSYAVLKYYLFVVVAVVVLLMTISGIASHLNPATVPIFNNYSDDMTWDESDNCDDEDYFQWTLKEEYTQSIGGMLKHSPNFPKFEASGVVYDQSRDVYWVVFDSLWSIAMLSSDLTRNDANMMIDCEQNNGDDDSGFEGR